MTRIEVYAIFSWYANLRTLKNFQKIVSSKTRLRKKKSNENTVVTQLKKKILSIKTFASKIIHALFF